MKSILLIVFIFLFGCTAAQPISVPAEQPKVIYPKYEKSKKPKVKSKAKPDENVTTPCIVTTEETIVIFKNENCKVKDKP